MVVPVFDPPGQFLRAALDSVRNQLYENWELCLVDDCSTRPEIAQTLQEYAALDDRIKIFFRSSNGNIAAATNTALGLATGEYVAFLDHDDELTVDALFEVVDCLNSSSRPADIVYTDHDKVDPEGEFIEPHFKPDWSPEYFRGVMYVCHLLCVRRELLSKVGELKSEFDGVQDYELMLRLSEHAKDIRHIPKVLYHWRMLPGSVALAQDAKVGIEQLQERAVNQHLAHVGLAAQATAIRGMHRVKVSPSPRKHQPLVSIIIPTRDAPDFLERCLQSIHARSTYESIECILGDNDTVGERTLQLIREFPCIRIPCPGKFSFSKVNNDCARSASGEFLLFLNNDTEVTTPNWIESLLFYAEQPDVGAVGPLLLYPDGTVQHAGVILGPRGTADHLMRGFPGQSDGYAGSLVVSREVSAVTGACLMTRRQVFEKVGGFNEHYQSHYQDIDLCLRMRQAGLRNIYTCNASLIHDESVTRGADYDLIDRYLLLDCWGEWIEEGDPYYSPNFERHSVDYRLRANSAS